MSEQDEFTDVPISAERLVAAFLKSTGGFEVSVEDLLEDYSSFQIAVDQENDGFVKFTLVEVEDGKS